MIKVNLFNKTTLQAQQSAGISDAGELILSKEELQKQAGIRLLIVILLPAAVFLYQENILLPDLNSQASTLSQDLAKRRDYNQKAGPAVAEIKKYEEERKNIERKIDFLNQLGNERGIELELHRFFQRSVPEKTWFNDYVYDLKNSRIVIKANSFSPQVEIKKFIDDIRSNVLFKSVELTRQSEIKFQGQSAEEFELLILVGKNRESGP